MVTHCEYCGEEFDFDAGEEVAVAKSRHFHAECLEEILEFRPDYDFDAEPSGFFQG